jgi:hypothetical protein
LIAGPIVLGVPWALGLLFASAANYENSSGWLVVPALGPWITLASRHRSNCSNSFDSCVDTGLDSMVQTTLVLDGLMQGAGAAMLIAGIASPKKVLARNIGRFTLTPAHIGRTGYGGLLSAQF